MFDTMTLTKAVGSLCGALLIFLLGKWAGELLYDTSPGHGGDDHAAGYVIEVADTGGGGEAEEGPSIAELWQTADAEKGAKVFGKCKACHKLEDGANATGPYLYGVVGRDVAAASGFGYSDGIKASADVWTPETLSGFLENPKGYAPGTTMAFAGLKKAADRINVIAYLDQLDGDTYEMAAPEPAAEEEAAVEAAEGSEETAAAEVAADEPVTEEAATEEAATEETATEETATEEEPAAEEAAEEEAAAGAASGFAAMVASADPADGEKVFKKCKACHKLEDGANGVGPHLYNLLDRDIASVEGFSYSDALTGLPGDWTADELSAYLTKPKEYAPGTKMSFAGLKKEEDRASVIAYIQSAAQ